jgi:hypothetical protein
MNRWSVLRLWWRCSKYLYVLGIEAAKLEQRGVCWYQVAALYFLTIRSVPERVSYSGCTGDVDLKPECCRDDNS